MKHTPRNEKYWAFLGHSFAGLEDFSEAVNAYRKSLEIYPRSDIFISLALVHQTLGDYQSAGQALESALDLEPDNIQALMLLAENFFYKEETEAGRQILEQILQIEPGNMVARERLMKLK